MATLYCRSRYKKKTIQGLILKRSRLLEKRNAGDLIIGKQEDLPKSDDLAPLKPIETCSFGIEQSSAITPPPILALFKVQDRNDGHQ